MIGAEPEGSGDSAPEPLLIPADLLDAMIAHCRREAPDECCGLLGGVPPRASAIYPLRNLAPTAATRYNADPVEVIEAVRDLRSRSEEIIAIYHSHPKWQAVPSRADLDLNHYGPLPRIIVSLLEEPPDVRMWKLDANSFEELPWRAVPVDPSRSGG